MLKLDLQYNWCNRPQTTQNWLTELECLSLFLPPTHVQLLNNFVNLIVLPAVKKSLILINVLTFKSAKYSTTNNHRNVKKFSGIGAIRHLILITTNCNLLC